MAYSAMGSPTNIVTPPHEMGHIFNLAHPFETVFGVECTSGSNCLLAGDRICDTPADPSLYTYPVDPFCVFVAAVTPPCSGDPPYDPDTSNFMSGESCLPRPLVRRSNSARQRPENDPRQLSKDATSRRLHLRRPR